VLRITVNSFSHEFIVGHIDMDLAGTGARPRIKNLLDVSLAGGT
jgi:hypothetical protein